MKAVVMSLSSHARSVTFAVTITSLLGGCATNSGMTRSDWGKCLGAIAAGAGVGALAHGERGAYIGAAVGIAACFAIKAHSRRVRSAAEVESSYRSRNSQLPLLPEVVAYETSLPGNSVRRGEPLKIVSNIEAVSGSSQSIREVKEQIRLYEPGAEKPFKTAEKIANESAGSGAYENTFTITFPANMPQGHYKIETDLFINGERIKRGSNQIQVVFDDGNLPLDAAIVMR